MNRLNLNFALQTTEERNLFLTQYLEQEQFIKRPLTAEECETCGNYVLWGKDPITGKNVVQDKSIQIATRHKTWDAHQDESLEGLLENPGFNETMIQPIITPPLKIDRDVFSRSKARKFAPKVILQQLENLWNEIDELDLLLNFYDLAHGKRKIPPRAFLLEKINEEKQLILQQQAAQLTQFKYLKLRHLLVDLRREQYSLRDSYSPTVLSTKVNYIKEMDPITLDSDIACLPLGIIYGNPLDVKLFPIGRFPNPGDFNEKELEQLSNFLRAKENLTNLKNFDFRNKDHLYETLCLFDGITDEILSDKLFSTSRQFILTLSYYTQRARLSDIHQEILSLKLQHKKNQDIAGIVNKKYGKTYTANYISTIFKQKILAQIANTAAYHLEVTQNLFFKENFKKCKRCGEILLISTENFVRKTRSSDGFSNQCKRCDKKQRLS